MSKTNGEDYASPLIDRDGNIVYESGLTKREHFAAMAMQGMIASYSHQQSFGNALSAYPKTGEHAVEHADALIKALNKLGR